MVCVSAVESGCEFLEFSDEIQSYYATDVNTEWKAPSMFRPNMV
jgi:hypothetical protein